MPKYELCKALVYSEMCEFKRRKKTLAPNFQVETMEILLLQLKKTASTYIVEITTEITHNDHDDTMMIMIIMIAVMLLVSVYISAVKIVKHCAFNLIKLICLVEFLNIIFIVLQYISTGRLHWYR